MLRWMTIPYIPYRMGCLHASLMAGASSDVGALHARYLDNALLIRVMHDYKIFQNIWGTHDCAVGDLLEGLSLLQCLHVCHTFVTARWI